MIDTDTTDFKSGKLISIKAAAKKADEFKKLSETVGLCHGGFDLMHPGHIKHLESASKLCTHLFVSITSDRFVASRKGSGRPLFSEKLRAYSIASLECVDYVFITDAEHATEVLRQLKPTYYIKGPDFINKSTYGITKERSTIKAEGGEIKYTTDKKLSTTDIIKHIKENISREKILVGIDRDGTLIEDVAFLGKSRQWKKQIKLKKEVVNFINYIQTKYDAVKVVLSNQQGVARGYFDIQTVEGINRHIDGLLRKNGIKIHSWQYCPYVDTNYASSMREGAFRQEFIKDKTKRKPSTAMLSSAMQELQIGFKDFNKILILGNSHDDEELAKNSSASYINVSNKTYAELKSEFNSI